MKIYFPKMISLFFVGALLLTACGGGGGDKEEEEPKDTASPVIATPTVSATASNVHYKGTFSDDLDLAKVVFTLTDTKAAGSAQLKAATGFDHEPWAPAAKTVTLDGKSGSYDDDAFPGETYDAATMWTGDYVLTVTLHDAAGKTATETYTVTLE